MNVVIVGNGVAGIEAARVVREREPSWDITVISEESDHFVSRTALMYVACGQLSHRDIEPHERDLYARLSLRRVRARATGVDTEDKRVHVAGGEAIRYDRLLIACGSRPRPAPWKGADLAGVGHFVTMQDLDWLEREVHERASPGGPAPSGVPGSPYARRPAAAEKRGRTSREPAVIGGGLIGIEVVEVLLAAGLRPKFFVREEWFWPMAIEPRESAWIAERLRAHGVDVLLEHDVTELTGDDAGLVAAIHTEQGGAHPADLAVVCIGVTPSTDWLEASPIERDETGGIVVDAGLRTSAEDVLAAGDCASVRWIDGTQHPEQLWYTARDQGRVAGRALCGDSVEYDRGRWYNSAKLMDVEYTTVGLVNMRLEGERNWFYEEPGPVRSTTRITLVDDRVVGFNLLGRRWDHEVLGRFIDEGRTLPWVLDHLDEASFDTEFTPPLRIPNDARTAELDGPAKSPARKESLAYPLR